MFDAPLTLLCTQSEKTLSWREKLASREGSVRGGAPSGAGPGPSTPGALAVPRPDARTPVTPAPLSAGKRAACSSLSASAHSQVLLLLLYSTYSS
jgi:hypothetical protein